MPLPEVPGSSQHSPISFTMAFQVCYSLSLRRKIVHVSRTVTLTSPAVSVYASLILLPVPGWWDPYCFQAPKRPTLVTGCVQVCFLTPGCIFFRVFWLQMNRKLLQVTSCINRKFIQVYRNITWKSTQRDSWAGTWNWKPTGSEQTSASLTLSPSPSLQLPLSPSLSLTLLLFLPHPPSLFSPFLPPYVPLSLSPCLPFLYMAVPPAPSTLCSHRSTPASIYKAISFHLHDRLCLLSTDRKSVV